MLCKDACMWQDALLLVQLLVVYVHYICIRWWATQLLTMYIVLCSKASPAGMHVLEDALRWGAEAVFNAQLDVPQPDQASHPSTPVSAGGDTHMQDPASPNHLEAGLDASPAGRQSPALPTVTSPFSAPEQQHQSHRALERASSSLKLRYTGDVVEKLLQWSTTAVAAEGDRTQAADAEANKDRADAAAQSLGQHLGAEWNGVRVHKWPQDAFDAELHGDEGSTSCWLQHACAPDDGVPKNASMSVIYTMHCSALLNSTCSCIL